VFSDCPTYTEMYEQNLLNFQTTLQRIPARQQPSAILSPQRLLLFLDEDSTNGKTERADNRQQKEEEARTSI
jgi:hypothetical protein